MNASRAICTLESMAIDMVGTLGGLSETNQIATVLERQIEAINMAQDALRAVRDLATNENASHISIDRMNEIMQAEREGRLVILPCKVGDSYYLVERFCTEGGYYDEKKQVSLGTCEWCSEECDRENRVVEFRFNSAIGILMKERFFGKTVFLTREEAEKALEETK